MNTQLLCFTLFILLLPTLVLAQNFNGSPDSLAYQGFLTDPSGNPIADGSYPVDFTLYDAATGGTTVWTENQLVTTNGGLYNVTLGHGTALTEVAFDKQLWLGVKVDSDPEMVPRTPLSAVPYAMSLRNLRVIPTNSARSVNMIGGSHVNGVGPGVEGATIGGGGTSGPAGGQLCAPSNPGNANIVRGNFGTIGGGFGNQACMSSTIGGGGQNTAMSFWSTIGGGSGNTADNTATIAGGENNTASGAGSAIAGGTENTASAFFSTVAGGNNNTAGGEYSFAAGYRAKVRDASQSGDANGDEGTFVWNDRSQNSDTDADNFTSTAPNQFLIRATGGVGIGTNSPDANTSLTLRARSGFNDVLSFYGNTGAKRWNLNMPGGDLNFAESGIADHRLYLKKGGNVGIGTNDPSSKLALSSYSTAANTYITLKSQGGNLYRTGIKLMVFNDNFGFTIENDERSGSNGLNIIRHAGTAAGESALFIDKQNGNIGIGNWTSPSQKLHVLGNVLANNVSLSSDARYKTSIESIPDALSIVKRLEGYRYTYNMDEFPKHGFDEGLQYGLVAQQVREVLPEIVHEDSDGYLSVKYQSVIPVLVEALKEQQTRNEALEARVTELERLVRALVER